MNVNKKHANVSQTRRSNEKKKKKKCFKVTTQSVANIINV